MDNKTNHIFTLKQLKFKFMSLLLDLYNLATSNDFYARVKMACYKVSVAIAGEDNTGMSVPLGNKRQRLAHSILNNAEISNFCYAILAANPSITDQSPDNDLEFLVSSVFNDIAGVTFTDLQ